MHPGKALTRKDVAVLLSLGVLGVMLATAAACLAGERKRRLLCMSQVHLNTRAILFHAADNDGNVVLSEAGWWPWDLSLSGCDVLTDYGIRPPMFYCPCDPGKSNQRPEYWQFSLVYGTAPPQFIPEPEDEETRKRHYRVTGYCWLLDHPQGRPDPIVGKPARDWVRNVNQVRSPATWELVVDATLSTTPDAVRASFSHIPGGMYAWLGQYDRSSHLDRNGRPLGGNMGLVDGHAEWRPFLRMQVRTSSGLPCFWW